MDTRIEAARRIYRAHRKTEPSSATVAAMLEFAAYRPTTSIPRGDWYGYDRYADGKFEAGYLLDRDQEPELREVAKFNCRGLAEPIGKLIAASIGTPQADLLAITDNRVCSICDGGPGNECACSCGFKKYSRVSEAMVDKALNARVPGGSEVMAWLPMADAWTPHNTARDVMRAALSAILDDPLVTAAPARERA